MGKSGVTTATMRNVGLKIESIKTMSEKSINDSMRDLLVCLMIAEWKITGHDNGLIREAIADIKKAQQSVLRIIEITDGD